MNVIPLYDEKLLMSRLSRGDHQAFDLIYRSISPGIYTNILRLVKQTDIAEEVLQNVFMKLWEKRETITVETSLRNYLFRVAHNQIMDLFRRAAFDKRLFDHLARVSTAFYTDTDEQTGLRDIQALLQAAVDALPPQRKKIWQLCKEEGKSYDEVSKMLNISTSTISDHIVKATRSVKAHLTDQEYTILLAVFLTSLHG